MQKVKIIMLFIISLLLVNCNKEEKYVEQGESVNLSLTISNPQIKLDTKGLDNPDDLTTWSDWEKAVDGRIIYSLTACLLERSSGNIIAFREIVNGGEDIDTENGFLDVNGYVDINLKSSDKVRVTFSYDNPKHGNIERLKRGEYSLIIVANYDPVTLDDGSAVQKKYSGLENSTLKFHEVLKTKITSKKTNFQKIARVDVSDLFTFKQDAGDDYLCPKQPQPLTLVKVLGLKSGDNNVSCVMERTYSRIRLEVENNSSSYNLSVNNLSYSTNFAQKQAYIFDDPDNLDLKYSITEKGSPDLDSDDAIVKFTPNTLIIDKYDQNNPANNRAVVFDGYIFESRDNSSDAPYKYNLDVEYKDVTNYIGGYKVDSTPINTLDAFSKSIGNNKKLFVLQSSYYPDRFIVSGKNKVTTAVTTIEEVCKAVAENNTTSYLWEYERKASGGDVNLFSLKTIGLTSYYFTPTVYNVGDSPIILTPELKNYYQMWGVNNNGLQFRVETSNYMIKVVPGDLSSLATTVSMTNEGTGMIFYSVTKEFNTPRYNKDIIFTVIDPVTSVANPVTEIKRNDFIRTLVTVNYNITGANIDFTVVPWKSVSGEIIFN